MLNPLALSPVELSGMVARLTPRQTDVVDLLARGFSIKYTAHILSISPATVKDHVRKACLRLELENRVQLTVVYSMYVASNQI